MNIPDNLNRTRFAQFLRKGRSCQNIGNDNWRSNLFICTSIFVGIASLATLTACTEQEHLAQNDDPTTTSNAVAKRAENTEASEQRPYSSMAIEVVNWPIQNEQALVIIRKNRHEFSEAVENLMPVVTRAGTLRFTDPLINDPDAATILLHRLANEGVSVEYRRALAEALGRTGGNYAKGACWLLSSEASDQVRSVLIVSLRNAPASWAALGLQLGFKDPSASVRAQAAITTSFRRDRHNFVELLVELLGDSSINVQVEATRSLATIPAMRDPAVLRQFSLNLNHPSPELRLHSLRAIERSDQNYARTLPALEQLLDDTDPRVRRVATRMMVQTH